MMLKISCVLLQQGHLLNLWWHRLNPGVCDFKVAVRIQKHLDGAWGHGAVLQNLEKRKKKIKQSPFKVKLLTAQN